MEALIVAACDYDQYNTYFWQPRQLLKAAIAAGANIYAINKVGNTPTIAAKVCNCDKEWIKALKEYRIDFKEVLLYTTV
jgi:hypothetical protein